MATAQDTACPEDWPDTIKGMRSLENLLRCPICCELMNTAMLVPKCSHTYCSLCIRRYSCFKSQCPTCAAPVSEPELVNNRLLDDIINEFLEIRPVLLQVVQQAVNAGVNISAIKNSASSSGICVTRQEANIGISRCRQNESAVSDDSNQSLSRAPGRPFAIFSQRGTARSATKRKYTETDCDSDDDFMIIDPPGDKKPKLSDTISQQDAQTSKSVESLTSPTVPEPPHTPLLKSPFMKTVVTPSMRVPSPANRSYTRSPGASSPLMSPGFVATPTMSRIASPSTSQSQGLLTPSNSKKVACPVCDAEVPERNINLHLDRCLSGSEKKENLRSATKRKLMPKLVYNLIKDGELRKKLAAVGLPLTGDRQTMISRHKEFTLIYNSECDSLSPRSAEEIVRDMMRSDREKQKQATVNPISNQLQIQKGASSDEVTKAQKDYVKKHKSQFAQLIADAKRRMKKEAAAASAEATTAAQDESTSVSTASDQARHQSEQNATAETMLPLVDDTNTNQDESSFGSDLFPDLPSINTINNEEETETSQDCNIPSTNKTDSDPLQTTAVIDSESSNCSESLLQDKPKTISNSDSVNGNDCSLDEEAVTLRQTPPDVVEAISMDSPIAAEQILSQISDSNDIPLTQASRSSRTTDVIGANELPGDSKIMASQESAKSNISASTSTTGQDNMSDYIPDLDELSNDGRGAVKKRKSKPKKASKASKTKTPQPKSRRSVDKDFTFDSENIDITNTDNDFVENPRRSHRKRKSKIYS